MFNRVILIGNLTRDIESRQAQTGTTVANSGLAVNRKYKTKSGENKEDAMFIDLTFFGKTAEIAGKYLKKGSKILIEGRLSLDQWSDQEGKHRSRHFITVDAMQMLDTKQSTSTAPS